MFVSLQNVSYEAEKSQIRREGFVDEAFVRKMVMSQGYQRQIHRDQTAMDSEDNDYAGWNLPASDPSVRR